MNTREIVWPQIIDVAALSSQVDALKASFLNAEPFPHIVLDNFLSTEWVNALVNEIPSYRDYKQKMDVWGELDSGKAAQFKKDYLSMEIRAGRLTRQLYWELNSSEFLQLLERITGIESLLPDPYLFGGGIHETRPGGYLLLHADFNKQKETGLDRRLNIILYLNEQWEEAYGGALQLWARDQSGCVKEVMPLAGRAVIFATEKDTWHGHPEPLCCPEDDTRKSFALYYYTRKRDGEEVPQHQTLWFDPDTD